jgi:hypothetical protein
MRLLFVSILYVLVIGLSMITQTGYALYFGNDLTFTNSSKMPSLFPKQLAATEKGDVYVVWADNYSIYFTSSHDNQKFGPGILLSQVNKQELSPQVIATEKSDVYVVWVDKNNKTGYSNIEFINSNDSGKTFSAQKELGGGKSLSSFPQLTATEKGDVYVVWVDKNNKTGYSNIEFINSNDSGMSFSYSKKLTGSKSLSSFPQLTATEKGDVYVVWVDKNNKTGDSDIIFRSSNDSGMSFDDRNKIRRSDSLLSFSPQLTATEKGDVYVVWVDKNSTTGDRDITFRSSNDRGRDFERVINLNKGEKKLSNSSLPQLATTKNDSVYVVWMDNQILFKELLVKDAIVGNTISLSNKTTSSLSPEITATKNGDIFVLWIDKNNTMDRSLLFKRISQDYFDRNS